MEEIMHVMVKQADDGDPSCKKGTGVIPQNSVHGRRFSPRPEMPW